MFSINFILALSVALHLCSSTEQMGRVLQRTSISTNIKERLDFSCAVFGPDGGLVSNAPHIPVHLGAMQETVQYQVRDVYLCEFRHVTETLKNKHPSLTERMFCFFFFSVQIRSLGNKLKEGDVILSNHPCAGGSHLPDLTVITPVSLPTFLSASSLSSLSIFYLIPLLYFPSLVSCLPLFRCLGKE